MSDFEAEVAALRSRLRSYPLDKCAWKHEDGDDAPDCHEARRDTAGALALCRYCGMDSRRPRS